MALTRGPADRQERPAKRSARHLFYVSATGPWITHEPPAAICQGGPTMTKKNRKLSLNRDTVLRLEDLNELRQVQGGIVSSDNMQCMRDRKKTIGQEY
jgi:hypothetical protein